VGLPGRYKGSHLVLRAFQALGPGKAELIIWGRGWDQIKTQYDKNEGISFMGAYDHERIGEVFSSFDILIVPSIWGETFSFIAHEGFFAGVPVIASNIGVFDDIIEDGRNGLLFERNDSGSLLHCMQRVAENPALIKTLKSNIQKPKTAEAFVGEICKIYDDLLKQD
jgi:glycosyltransferase involved in cell wall biosynthesis